MYKKILLVGLMICAQNITSSWWWPFGGQSSDDLKIDGDAFPGTGHSSEGLQKYMQKELAPCYYREMQIKNRWQALEQVEDEAMRVYTDLDGNISDMGANILTDCYKAQKELVALWFINQAQYREAMNKASLLGEEKLREAQTNASLAAQYAYVCDYWKQQDQEKA